GVGPRGALDECATRGPFASSLRRARPPAETMKPRCTTAQWPVARRTFVAAGFAVLAALPPCRRAEGQGGGWEAFPANPTVGDTIWLVRALTVPAGWQVRAGKLEPTEGVEPLPGPLGG